MIVASPTCSVPSARAPSFKRCLPLTTFDQHGLTSRSSLDTAVAFFVSSSLTSESDQTPRRYPGDRGGGGLVVSMGKKKGKKKSSKKKKGSGKGAADGPVNHNGWVTLRAWIPHNSPGLKLTCMASGGGGRVPMRTCRRRRLCALSHPVVARSSRAHGPRRVVYASVPVSSDLPREASPLRCGAPTRWSRWRKPRRM